MLSITIENDVESKEIEHAGGPLEFGRGPRGQTDRYVVSDPFMSRDHVRVEELAEGQLRIENLSQRNPVTLSSGQTLGTGDSGEVELPTACVAGKTRLHFRRLAPGREASGMTTINQEGFRAGALSVGRANLPDIETLGRWFETVIAVQQAAAESDDFYAQTARAVVELVGLDRGLVLVRAGSDWKVIAMHTTGDQLGPNYSRSILDEVFRHRATFCRRLTTQELRESLAHVEAVVAAPVLDRNENVSGVVYGSRLHDSRWVDPEIRPLEAKLVEVLAAAVGAGLARERHAAEASRSQEQFAQFVSPQVARELARDPNLLEGRERELTVLFSDVRNSTSIAEQLGPRATFRLMQDVMDLQSARIREFDGSVVDYYGDGLTAMWNAPLDQPDHAARACQAALAFMHDLPEVSAKWQEVLRAPLALGVGINTGLALVGNAGSRVKLKYGPIGPTVNLASRVESTTKRLGVPILITQSTHARLGTPLATRRLCQARLAGLADPVTLYELVGADCTPAWKERAAAFERALTRFEAGHWIEACQALHALIADEEGQFDVPSLTLLSRAVECLKSRPDPFDPVLPLGDKA